MGWLRDHFTARVQPSPLDHVFCQFFQVWRQIISRFLQSTIETSKKTILYIKIYIITKYRQNIEHLLAIYILKSEKECRFKVFIFNRYCQSSANSAKIGVELVGRFNEQSFYNFIK